MVILHQAVLLPSYPLKVYPLYFDTNCEMLDFACLYSDYLILLSELIDVATSLPRTSIFLPWTLAAMVSHTILANY